MACVAIVIPTYNNLEELRRCLHALYQQTYTDFIAYVCVDGSTDETLAYLERYAPPFVCALTHPDKRNHGRNATRNLVLPYLSQHKWLAFLDSDSLPLPNWLAAFMEAQPRENEILLGNILYFSEYNPNIWQKYLAWREKKRAKGPLSFKNFITINALMSASLFMEIGGMDAHIHRHGLGDVELGWRLQTKGASFRFVPKAKVWSHVQQDHSHALLRLYDMGRHNLTYLHKKHPQTRTALFGGKWLTQRWRWFLLRIWLNPYWAKKVLHRLPSLPKSVQLWGMRFLVFYAVARGYWGLRLGLHPPKRERPFI
ncbi:MAG: glycosyltransferase family A protein [Bacteroidia bacterium]|nr:glycosyltransferase family 2 protein [Bacteroidia bacterium]MDW8134816.1 glycosyltransferase family A protein [Bacteroidia bacterium]